ncbi:unnamed protein product [Victoria cruziana]
MMVREEMQMMGSFHAAGDARRKRFSGVRFSGVFGGFGHGSGGRFSIEPLMSSSSSSSLVLDSQKGERVKASNLMRKEMAEAMPRWLAVALKSHREAERKRRERINHHLTMLRGLENRAEGDEWKEGTRAREKMMAMRRNRAEGR